MGHPWDPLKVLLELIGLKMVSVIGFRATFLGAF